MASKNLSASDIANKWATSMGSASQAYTNGVNNVSVSPGQSALQNAQNYINGVQEAYNNGTYQKGLQSFSLQQWQQAAVSKGSSRLGSGAQASKPKMQNFFQQFIPALQGVMNQVNSIPRGSYDQNKARANALMDGLHALKGTLKQ